MHLVRAAMAAAMVAGLTSCTRAAGELKHAALVIAAQVAQSTLPLMPETPADVYCDHRCLLPFVPFLLAWASLVFLWMNSNPNASGTAFAFHTSIFSNHLNSVSPFATKLQRMGMLGRKRHFSKLVLKGSISSMFQSKGRTPEALKETAALLARKKFDLDIDAILAIEAERKVVQSKTVGLPACLL